MYYSQQHCLQKLADTDWSTVTDELNVDVANSHLEELILATLNSEAPMKTVQMRTNYCKWLTQSTKDCMTECDTSQRGCEDQ